MAGRGVRFGYGDGGGEFDEQQLERNVKTSRTDRGALSSGSRLAHDASFEKAEPKLVDNCADDDADKVEHLRRFACRLARGVGSVPGEDDGIEDDSAERRRVVRRLSHVEENEL